ncbi:MAG: 4-hydroxy-tetrahydrodipicolinate synthase [Pseudomonadota bacterium]
MVDLQGSSVALVTPMVAGVGAEIAIDWEALARLIAFHMEAGTQTIVAVGTTGESATLTEEEHIKVIEFVIAEVAGRIPVIAGTGGNATHEAITLTRAAEKAGANACLLVTPYYNKPTQEGLYQHFMAIADACSIPQVLYNVPGRTACDMSAATIGRLAAHTNIVGVKEATGEVDRVAEIRELCGPSFCLLSGDDLTACEFMLAGGDGVISVTANAAPRAMRELCDAARDGDESMARAIDEKLRGLHRDLFVESNPIPIKWLVHKMGFIEAGIRLPLTWLSSEFENLVEDALKQVNT